MSSPEPDGKKPSLFRRVAGGSASRAKLYGIVGATFVLIVGGVSGAAVLVSHQGSTPAATTTTSQATSSLPRPAVSAGSTTSTSLPARAAVGSPAFPNSGPADNGTSSQFNSPNATSPVLTTTTTTAAPLTVINYGWTSQACGPLMTAYFIYSDGTRRVANMQPGDGGGAAVFQHDDLGNALPGHGLTAAWVGLVRGAQWLKCDYADGNEGSIPGYRFF